MGPGFRISKLPALLADDDVHRAGRPSSVSHVRGNLLRVPLRTVPDFGDQLPADVRLTFDKLERFQMTSLSELIRMSLSEFAHFLRGSQWRGREREAVSLYACSYLQHHLDDPRRICIEGAVPGLQGLNAKRQVCKDLVIWPAAAMTTWDSDWNPAHVPAAVLEWKLFRKASVPPNFSAHDGGWLREFSRQNPEQKATALPSIYYSEGPCYTANATLAERKSRIGLGGSRDLERP